MAGIMTQRQSLSGEVELRLPEFETPPSDPLVLLRRWLSSAVDNAVREPGAATLATVGPSGPSTRTVLIKDINESGLIFTTSGLSRKGRELEADARCSVNLYWRETMQQIVVNGCATPCGDVRSNIEFDARPRSARAAAIASSQSEELLDEADLRDRTHKVLELGELLRPPGWHAWCLVPGEVEFWHGGADRFHRRLVYRSEPAHGWRTIRLQP